MGRALADGGSGTLFATDPEPAGLRVPFPLLRRQLRWALVAIVGGAVGGLPLLAGPHRSRSSSRSSTFPPPDKWRHVRYAAVAGSLAYATAEWDWPGWRLAALVVGTTVAFGLAIEGVQGLLPYRTPGDAVAEVVGGLLVLPWFLLRPYARLVPIGGADD